MLICDRCGAVNEQHAQGVESILESLAQQSGFALRNSVIEAHGLCNGCKDVESCQHPESCNHDHTLISKKRGR